MSLRPFPQFGNSNCRQAGVLNVANHAPKSIIAKISSPTEIGFHTEIANESNIRANEIDTIFDEYRQVKGSGTEQKGTGLGLSITRKFAELLGGSISVASEVGKGSTFTVRIPMVYTQS